MRIPRFNDCAPDLRGGDDYGTASTELVDHDTSALIDAIDAEIQALEGRFGSEFRRLAIAPLCLDKKISPSRAGKQIPSDIDRMVNEDRRAAVDVSVDLLPMLGRHRERDFLRLSLGLPDRSIDAYRGLAAEFSQRFVRNPSAKDV